MKGRSHDSPYIILARIFALDCCHDWTATSCCVRAAVFNEIVKAYLIHCVSKAIREVRRLTSENRRGTSVAAVFLRVKILHRVSCSEFCSVRMKCRCISEG